MERTGLGETVGVEEEYHLVDPETFALARRAELVARALEGGLGADVHAEMLTSQLEAVTPVCRSLGELHDALARARTDAAAAAASADAMILAASTHPFAGVDEIELMQRPRYDRLAELYGDVLRINLCGCHIHVGVPDLETAVAIHDRARAYLPLLVALSASSPFYLGRDTGYDSFRVPLLAVLPQGGPPPMLSSAENFLRTVDDLRAHGLVEDATGVLWGLRPSTKYPTLEFRMPDVCTDVRDTLLIAALVRSLVRVLGARDPDERVLSDPALRAACWHAARYGTANRLWSPSRADVVPAPTALDELVAELRPDLEAHDEFDVVAELFALRRVAGSSSERQRRVFAVEGSLPAVVRDGVDVTAGRRTT